MKERKGRQVGDTAATRFGKRGLKMHGWKNARQKKRSARR
jgi:hypothetical protein